MNPKAKTDRETGVPKVDRETGEAQWQVQLAALDNTGGEVLLVTVAGRPDVGVGSPVAVEDLVAIPWSQGDRSGVAYRAGPSGRSAPPSRVPSAPARSIDQRPTRQASRLSRLRARPRPRIARAGPVHLPVTSRSEQWSEASRRPWSPRRRRRRPGGHGRISGSTLTWAVFKFKLRLIVWAVLFPMLSVPILLTSAAGEQGGPTAASCGRPGLV